MAGYLPDVTGAILVMAVAATCAVLGLAAAACGFLVRRRWLRIGGLLVAAPGLSLLALVLLPLVPELVPRALVWDLRSDRRASQLGVEAVAERHSFQGNLHTEVLLPDGPRWSGRAALVVFSAPGGVVEQIAWQGRREGLAEACAEARRILGQLGLPVEPLEAWRARFERGAAPALFSIDTDPGRDPEIWLRVRGYADAEDAPATSWSVLIDVVFRTPAP
jgi:hypothetical protein